MKLAIMQPYLFPYIGYFNLIQATDNFVFYDDVNFIKQGWINRNRILVNGSPLTFTVPLSQPSSFEKICNTNINSRFYEKWRDKFLRTLEQSYSKAPYFEETFKLVNDVLIQDVDKISTLAINSVKSTCSYLNLPLNDQISSINFPESQGMDRMDRIIEICNKNKLSNYINSIGGSELYDKELFTQYGIKLQFLKPELLTYNQRIERFTPGLSIIDLMMELDKVKVLEYINSYRLV